MNKFKTELTAKEIKQLEAKILAHFKQNARFDKDDKMILSGSFEQINKNIGLAYTSSSSYAALWVCNNEVYLDTAKKYHYIGFTFDLKGWAVAVLWDNEENEIVIYI